MEFLICWFGGFITMGILYYIIDYYLIYRRKKNVWRHVPKHMRIR